MHGIYRECEDLVGILSSRFDEGHFQMWDPRNGLVYRGGVIGYEIPGLKAYLKSLANTDLHKKFKCNKILIRFDWLCEASPTMKDGKVEIGKWVNSSRQEAVASPCLDLTFSYYYPQFKHGRIKMYGGGGEFCHFFRGEIPSPYDRAFKDIDPALIHLEPPTDEEIEKDLKDPKRKFKKHWWR
jgi:hypothetical protein